MCKFCVQIIPEVAKPQPVMYGNMHYWSRAVPLVDVVAQGMQWVVEDFVTTMVKIGVDPKIAARGMRTYFVTPTEAPGGNHIDPLAGRPYADLPTLRETYVMGWKVNLMVEGDAPEYSRVYEGSQIAERNNG